MLSMLLSQWTPAIIAQALAVLSESQRELFLFHLDYKERNKREPSLAVYKTKFGFPFLDEYNAEVEKCMYLVKSAFGSMGLTSVNDLEFDTPGTSTDGKRLPPKPIKRKTPKAAV
jgi:hypothetical protein